MNFLPQKLFANIFRKSVSEKLKIVLPKKTHSEVFHFRLCPHLASKDDFNQRIFILFIYLRCSINFRNTSLERTLAAPCQTHSGTTSHQQAIPAHLSVQQKLPLCLGTWKNEMNHHWPFRSFHQPKKTILDVKWEVSLAFLQLCATFQPI